MSTMCKQGTISVLAAWLGLTAAAWAGPNQPELRITASSAAGRGSIDVSLSELDVSGAGLAWQHPAAREIRSGDGRLIAALGGGRLAQLGDTIIDLAFSVTAGMADTTFEISSSLLSFPPLAAAEAKASAALTLTDGDGDGAWITGLQGNEGSIFAARLNGFQSEGATFTSLLGPISTGPYSSVAIDDVFPAGSRFEPFGWATDMSIDLHFTLSALDSASGTANFAVRPTQAVPEPSSLAGLLVLLLGYRVRGYSQPGFRRP